VQQPPKLHLHPTYTQSEHIREIQRNSQLSYTLTSTSTSTSTYTYTHAHTLDVPTTRQTFDIRSVKSLKDLTSGRRTKVHTLPPNTNPTTYTNPI
jgi:secreted trypsin-like serine protease